MSSLAPLLAFQPRSPDAAGVITWVHFGDLHMTKAGEQNHLDLVEIVNEVNRAFLDSISFVFLPGDVADDGSRSLPTQWCAPNSIVSGRHGAPS